MIQAYIDGSSKGNPGKSGAGIAIYDNDNQRVLTMGVPLGHGTNNQAELKALQVALDELIKLDYHQFDVIIQTDSKLVVGIFSQRWKANYNLEIINPIKETLSTFKRVIFTHVRAHSGIEQNVLVDRLASEAAMTQLHSAERNLYNKIETLPIFQTEVKDGLE